MTICNKLEELIRAKLAHVLKLRGTKKSKPDGSYVSEGDLLMEKVVFDYITSLGDEYYLISEEKDNSDFSFDQYRFAVTIDPIDGTENFVSGLKEWGVGISIYEKGRHVESMIALPELNIYLKTGDDFPKYESRIYGLSSSLSKEDLIQLDEGYEYRIIGCCMYNMYNVLTGSYAVFENPNGVWSWDILPGLNLALENNCKVTLENQKYNGEFLYPNKRYRFKIEN